MKTTDNPIYRKWIEMRRRCLNPLRREFPRYGGRGIKICERWMSFSNFQEDMLPTWKPGLSLDRIDNDGDYSPDNCRWATISMQNRNTSQNHRINVNGETLTIAEWSERTGLVHQTIRHRLLRGWSPEQAVYLPLQPNGSWRHNLRP